MDKEVVIIAARRTPIGAFLGTLSSLTAPELGAATIHAVQGDSGLEASNIDEVLMGCILPAGLGQAPARQAALKGGIPKSVPCATINKMCGSGMKAVMLATDAIRAGSAEVVMAGGMESMSNAPHLLLKGREGLAMGEQILVDHMFYDGLQDPENGELMGYFAELCADQFSFDRAQQDAYAIESVKRSIQAIQNGAFAQEIVPLTVLRNNDEITIDIDEQPLKCDLQKIPGMKPAFRSHNGTLTAANSSSISDGAATVLLMDSEKARDLGCVPLARIVGHASHAQAPAQFTTAPIGSIKKLYEKVRWTDADVDLYEINEAFAVVTMAAIKALDIEHTKVNVNGGACALGHPVGATGARILVTLIYALKQRGLKRGIASLCIGGGEATAIALEII